MTPVPIAEARRLADAPGATRLPILSLDDAGDAAARRYLKTISSRERAAFMREIRMGHDVALLFYGFFVGAGVGAGVGMIVYAQAMP